MLNPFKEVNWNPGPAERRKFALSLVIGFPCIALVLLLVRWLFTHAWHLGPALWLGGVGAGVGLVLLVLPVIARPFYVVWFGAACCIGIIVSNLIFALFYFIVMTGAGLLRRALGRQSFSKGFDKSAKTYWLPAEQPSDPKRYFSQF
jgi:hypothetical protein